MKDFKFFMGFILLGMAVYLMIGLPKDMLVSTVAGCIAVSFAVWIYARFAPFGSSVQRRIATAFVALVIMSGGIHFSFGTLYALITDDTVKSGSNTAHWVDFSPEILKNAHAGGQHVMIDFTANWCMNCQYNKVTVLHTRKIMDLVDKKKIITMKADLTSPDSLIESLMSHLGSRSVPFLAIFPGNDPYRPVVMRDLLSKNDLTAVLEKLGE
jgi:thiol:disulfide interchange protein